MLYLLYIQNLTSAALKGHYTIYADDTILLYANITSQKIEEEIKSDIKIFEKWLIFNMLCINVKKTKFILIKNKNKQDITIDIKINGESIAQTDNIKYLGLVMDKKLNWEGHTKNISRKISPIIGAIKRCPFITEQAGKVILNSLVIPHLTYQIVIWGRCATNEFNRIQRLQNKAIKTINKLNNRTPTEQLYANEILTLNEIFKYEQIKLVHKIINGKTKHNLKIEKKNKDIHQHLTRNRDHYHLKTNRTNSGRNKITHQVYNRLPETIRKCHSEAKFKREGQESGLSGNETKTEEEE